MVQSDKDRQKGGREERGRERQTGKLGDWESGRGLGDLKTKPHMALSHLRAYLSVTFL